MSPAIRTPGSTRRQRTRELAPDQLRRSYVRTMNEDPAHSERFAARESEEPQPAPWVWDEQYGGWCSCYLCSNQARKGELLTAEIRGILLGSYDPGQVAFLPDGPGGTHQDLAPAVHSLPPAARGGRSEQLRALEESLFEYVELLATCLGACWDEGPSCDEEYSAIRGKILDALTDPEDLAVLRRAVGTSNEIATSLEVAVGACLFAPFWLRRPREWKPGVGMSLLDHLFCLHPAPRFLYGPWFSTTEGIWRTWSAVQPTLKWMNWFILLGRNANLRKSARLFGWSIPSGFVHSLLRLSPPAPRTNVEAVQREGARPSAEEIWFGSRIAGSERDPGLVCLHAELLRLGATEVDVRRIASHDAFAADPTEDARNGFGRFWRETVRWVIEHRDSLTDDDCQLVLDWVMYKYTEARREGHLFNWAGRRPGSVLAAAKRYADAITRTGHENLRWPSRRWDWRVGQPPAATWSFYELSDGRELAREGRALRHCVGGYAPHCFAGHAVIVSLRRDSRRCVTIQVDPSSMSVVQARGLHNRCTTPEEEAVIGQWVAEVLHRG